jgi:alpha-1,6-mannosyltransferase
MLPNVFALVLTLHAFSSWIELDEEKQNRDDLFQRCTRASAVMLVAAATIFRCDLVILVFTVGLSWLLCGQLTVGMALVIGVVTVSVCLLFTVPLDSMLWQKWTWPEGVVLYYNTVLNKSSDWGTSPWYWYWTSALPRALLFGFPLFPMSLLRVPESMVCLWEWWRRSKTTKNPAGKSLSSQRPGWQRIQFVADSTWIPYLLPALGYVALYSFLGHKEVRFLFPVLPLFNVGVAVALSRIHAMLVYPGKDKPVSGVAQLIYAGGIGALVLSLAASLAFVEVSRRNYPGGLALDALTHHVQKEQQGRIAEIRVHVDVASAMTGVSKFAEREAQTRTPHVAWTFSKAGYEEQHLIRSDGNMSGFTHLLSEIPSVRGFHMLKAIPGNPRLDLKRLRVTTSDAIYVLENDEFR